MGKGKLKKGQQVMLEELFRLSGLDIAEWHKETFPDADVEGQVLKLSEEFEEFKNAPREDAPKEIADCFIVAASLAFRFNNALGKAIFVFFMKNLESKCLGEINKKMKINRSRKWVRLGDGRYKHVEGGEENGVERLEMQPTGGWDREIARLKKLNDDLILFYNRRFKPKVRRSDFDFRERSKSLTALKIAQVNGTLWAKIQEREKNAGK